MAQVEPPRKNLGFAFRALRHRNYRLFFAGQAVSLIGTWITRIATGWLVYRLTGSALMLGLVSFVGLVPTFLLTPLGGVAADRWNRHRVLLGTQGILMMTSLSLAYFALRGTITVPHVLALGALQGLCNAFDIPARRAEPARVLHELREGLASPVLFGLSYASLVLFRRREESFPADVYRCPAGPVQAAALILIQGAIAFNICRANPRDAGYTIILLVGVGGLYLVWKGTRRG